MEKLLIFGAGGHASVVAEIARALGRYEVADCVTPEREDRALREGPHRGVVAIGDNTLRLKVAEKVRSLVPEFEFVTLIHPAACVASDVILGEGTVVMAGAVVNPGVITGSHVIVNTRASVDHKCRLAKGCAISPGATLGGAVTVGARAWIGLGASVIEHRHIGAGTVVGAGAVVIRDLPAETVAVGNPARVLVRQDA